mmetsp:Transcript_25138/g.87702  ORF Transcript_25138/g.87702 Transcript_25138/m.87702 type:complete len:239 (-) Transcript_25138:344-1060(-)
MHHAHGSERGARQHGLDGLHGVPHLEKADESVNCLRRRQARARRRRVVVRDQARQPPAHVLMGLKRRGRDRRAAFLVRLADVDDGREQLRDPQVASEARVPKRCAAVVVRLLDVDLGQRHQPLDGGERRVAPDARGVEGRDALLVGAARVRARRRLQRLFVQPLCDGKVAAAAAVARGVERRRAATLRLTEHGARTDRDEPLRDVEVAHRACLVQRRPLAVVGRIHVDAGTREDETSR